MNISRATKDPKIRKVGVASSERDKGDDASSLGPRAVTYVARGEKGEAPKPIKKGG